MVASVEYHGRATRSRNPHAYSHRIPTTHSGSSAAAARGQGAPARFFADDGVSAPGSDLFLFPTGCH